MKRKISFGLILVLCMGLLLSVCSWAAVPTPILQVHFLDVGQADCILVQLPNGQSMLVDGGNQPDAKSIQGYLKELKITSIDYMVATHPHEDHIGGLAAIVDSMAVGKIYMPAAATTTKTYQNLMSSLKAKKVPVTQAKAGVVLVQTPDLSVVLVSPIREQYDNLNNYSAAVRIVYRERSFLLAGDMEALAEGEITAPIQADVLKVGHHGSDTSSSKPFLQKVAPSYAVISVGKKNTFGHPSSSVLKTFADLGCPVYRTDQSGTIVFKTDGKKITTTALPSPAPAK